MRAVLILNPVAERSPLAESHEASISIADTVLHALRIYDIEPKVWYTKLEDPGERLACKAVDERFDLVIAAGGDGTIHDVASGLLEREHAGYHPDGYDEQPCTQPGCSFISQGGLCGSCQGRDTHH